MIEIRWRKKSVTPEREKPSGHDEAAVLKPKPLQKLYKLLTNKQLNTPPPGQMGTLKRYVTCNAH